MEPRIGGRKALFDIGITGPLAGLVPTLIFCVLGLYLTEPKAIPPVGHRSQLAVGCPLLFRVLAPGNSARCRPTSPSTWACCTRWRLPVGSGCSSPR